MSNSTHGHRQRNIFELWIKIKVECKRQGNSEPCAMGKLSHLLLLQLDRTIRPASVNSDESSHLPSRAHDCDGPADLRVRPSFVQSQRPGSIAQRPDSR